MTIEQEIEEVATEIAEYSRELVDLLEQTEEVKETIKE